MQQARETGKELLASNLPTNLAKHHRARSKTGFLTPIAMWLESGAASLKPIFKAPVSPHSHWSRRWACVLAGQFGFDPLRSSKPAQAYSSCHLTGSEERSKASFDLDH